jgi:hypothetical protein
MKPDQSPSSPTAVVHADSTLIYRFPFSTAMAIVLFTIIIFSLFDYYQGKSISSYLAEKQPVTLIIWCLFCLFRKFTLNLNRENSIELLDSISFNSSKIKIKHIKEIISTPSIIDSTRNYYLISTSMPSVVIPVHGHLNIKNLETWLKNEGLTVQHFSGWRGWLKGFQILSGPRWAFLLNSGALLTAILAMALLSILATGWITVGSHSTHTQTALIVAPISVVTGIFAHFYFKSKNLFKEASFTIFCAIISMSLSIPVLLDTVLLTTATPVIQHWQCTEQSSTLECKTPDKHSFQVDANAPIPRQFQLSVHTNRWGFAVISRRDLNALRAGQQP